MEERRLLLAIALSLLVLTGYQLLFPPTPASRRPAAASPAPAAPREPTPAAAPAPPQTVAPVAAAAPAVSDEQERRVEVEGEDLALAFTNRGARLLSWRLPRFRDARGRPEEMVEASPGGARPLDVDSGDAARDAQLRDALFRPSAQSLRLGGAEAALRFEYAQGDLRAEKRLRFSPRGYLVEVSFALTQAGRELPVRLLWGPGVGNPTPEEKAVQGYEPPHGVYLAGAGVERLAAEKLATQRVLPEVRWAGVEARYFAALWVPPGGRGPAELRALPVATAEGGEPRLAPAAAVLLPSGRETALLYVGPKDHQVLARLGHELARVVPVGDWLGPIVVPLMAFLRAIHAHVGNYGWSIVVLTVLINLALAPLRHYSIANGMKMAKLSPEMRVIQERYRKVPALDPRRQEMQKEVAELYARHGMSMGSQMLAGCLPLLLTLPFLFALYRVLQISIELRGAAFLWIPDLSQKDPLFVTPLLLGVSMFVMQKITPTAMDPAQQRVMMIMPLMLVVMFFAAPAGLNLYWLASNLCSIAQQAVTLRILRVGEPETARRDKGRRR